MLKQATEIQAIQRQFADVNAMLTSIMSRLTQTGNPMVSTAIQDITRVSQTIYKIEQNVSDNLSLRKSQLTALMEIGSVINSSLGKERVLEEVMDCLIALMHAERGFLMLLDSKGNLTPQ